MTAIPPVLTPYAAWIRASRDTGATAGSEQTGGQLATDSGTRRSTQSGTSRAFNMNGSNGSPAAFRVQADRFDDEIEFVGAVDLARYTIGHTGPEEVGFGEVIEPVNPPRIAVLHEDHGVRRVFRP
jgi:hypothetical protein